jgi:hypothetical protein
MQRKRKFSIYVLYGGGVFILFSLILNFLWVEKTVSAQASPLHPRFPFLDEYGENVIESGYPVSTMKTCGSCHETGFIERHSFHASVGLEDFTNPGQIIDGRDWDTSPGYFGKWSPLTYRYLSPVGDALLDLGTPEWVQMFTRHVGGGPAVYGRNGVRLTEMEITPGDP